MNRALIQLPVLFVMLLACTSGFACGDLDLICKQREGQLNLPIPTPRLPDSECRGDICKTISPVTEESKRAVNNLASELGKTPQAIQECLGNVPRCATMIMSAPVAIWAQAYIDGLYRQA